MSTNQTFGIADDHTLTELIRRSVSRLVVMAPGLTEPVAMAIYQRVTDVDRPAVINVILDTDPEVCRLGYGDLKAVEIIMDAMRVCGHQLLTHQGLRVGLVISDDDIVVFTPTPRLIEAGSTSTEKPNAIRLAGGDVGALIDACESNNEEGNGTQEVGLEVVSDYHLRRLKADLDKNPPKTFDLARLERVFNYKLEFIEFSLEDVKLTTRTVSLDPALLGLDSDEVIERFQNTYRLFGQAQNFELEIPHPILPHRKVKLNEKYLTDEANRIRKRFIRLGSIYGNLIRKSEIGEFKVDIENLQGLLDQYKQKVIATMEEELELAKEDLRVSLLPRLKASPPKNWRVGYEPGPVPPDRIEAQLNRGIEAAFADARTDYDPKIRVIRKGVNYETVRQDKGFRKRLSAVIKDHEIDSLLDEFEASRGDDMPPQNKA